MSTTLVDLVEASDRTLTMGREVASGEDDGDPAVMAAVWSETGWPTEVDPEAKARLVIPEGQDPDKVTVLRTRPGAGLPWTYVAVVSG